MEIQSYCKKLGYRIRGRGPWMGTLLVDGDAFPFPRPWPFALSSALWLDLLLGIFSDEGSFLFLQIQGTAIQALPVDGGEVFCRLFSCKDFRSMILSLSMIRVRQSWDTFAGKFADGESSIK